MEKEYSSPYIQHMPETQANHHRLSTEAISFLQDICSNGRHPQNYSLHIRKDGKFKKITSLRGDALIEFTQQMHVSEKLDYYIAKNPSKNGKRTLGSMCSLENIVIDIDCHQQKVITEELRPTLDEFLWHLQGELFVDNIVPEPSYVVYTGRGVQLWWTFESNNVTKCYLGKFDKVKETWINHIKATLATFQSDFPLTVDQGASMNNMGLVRLPGSVNTRTGSIVEVAGDRVDRYDLHREYDNLTPLPGEKMAQRHYAKNENFDWAALSKYRIELITKLRDLRNAPIGQETRNDMNFLVYCAALMANSPEAAYIIMERFNMSFKEPMRPNELKNVVCSAKRKDGYKFRTSTLLKKLNVTTEEAVAIGVSANGVARGKNDARNERRAKKRARRNKAIVKAFCLYGSIQAAANSVGCDPRTAAKVIHAHLEMEAAKKATKAAVKTKKASTKTVAYRAARKPVEVIHIAKEKLVEMFSNGSIPDADFSGAIEYGLPFCAYKNGRVRMYLVNTNPPPPAYGGRLISSTSPETCYR